MNPLQLCRQGLLLAAILWLPYRVLVFAADDPQPTKDQIKHFLLTANVVSTKEAKKGITHTSRLTLSDGQLTHDASFQTIDEHDATKKLTYTTEIRFVDSYKYNVAAYGLAELLGLDDMLPVYVERKIDGKLGSLSWWLPVKMDEETRYTKKIPIPDQAAWNDQMHRVRVFDQLVSDSDPNLTNVLIGQDWHIWRIDFTRAFRLNREAKDPKELERCDRRLFASLKSLDESAVAEKTKGFLTKEEVKAVMARRDKIVAQFQRMISEKGENAILY